MWSVVHAQFAERWRQTRWQMLLNVAMLVVGGPCAYYAFRLLVLSEANAGQEAWRFMGAFCTVSLLAHVGALSLIPSFRSTSFVDRNQVRGFPSYGFRLPIKTSILVACPMAYGFVVSAVSCAFSLFVITRVTGIESPPVGLVALFVGTLSATLHAANWSVAGPLRRVLCCAAVLAILGMWFVGHVDRTASSYKHLLFVFSDSSYIFLFCCAAIAYPISVFNVSRLRCGEQIQTPSSWTIIRRLVDFLPWPESDYKSPRNALFWFEMKRAGILLPLGNAAAALIVFFIVLPYNLSYPSCPPAEQLISAWACMYGLLSGLALIFAAPISVSGLALDNRTRHLSPFDMTLPLAVRDLTAV